MTKRSIHYLLTLSVVTSAALALSARADLRVHADNDRPAARSDDGVRGSVQDDVDRRGARGPLQLATGQYISPTFVDGAVQQYPLSGRRNLAPISRLDGDQRRQEIRELLPFRHRSSWSWWLLSGIRRRWDMSAERHDKIDELASDLDDLTLTVEELQDELPSESEAEPLRTIKAALEQASEATDELGNRRRN